MHTHMCKRTLSNGNINTRNVKEMKKRERKKKEKKKCIQKDGENGKEKVKSQNSLKVKMGKTH